ncbi:DUF254-domain-containing protein [Wilcoxina mikolae CBS 423.85]|nr:DUF254-domain-containing protein [Wilcoxina mikolae CBS 423.85]
MNMNEDYFSAPLPPRLSTTKTPSQLLSLQPSTLPSASGSTTPGLQSKATIAISLPEGVYAQQQDGVNSGGSGSVTTAPSFSDSTSIKSFAPTLSTGDNDVESMLGEILEESDVTFSGPFVEEIEDETEDEDTASEDEEGLSEEELLIRWRAKRKHFFILSAAGKPIYSRYGNESIISSYIGVIQAIISFFADSSDTLQSFESGTHRFAVTSSGPIYLVAISSIGETPAQLRSQLDALYTQVLSTLTLSQLNKVFSQRFNFDLRRLLGGTEVFLDGLVDSMTRGSPQVLLSAIECVKIRKAHRERINCILLKARLPNVLYGLIVADQRLVSVIRPKRHSLHPPDLQLLFSMLFNAATFRDGGEHWTPICMPKFNSKGFLHAYIHFFQPEVCVVLISADKDAFFEMREMAASVIAGLKSSYLIEHITAAVSRYKPIDIIPGTPIRHFLYKSRQNVQFTMPDWGKINRRRVMTLYHKLHAAVHTKHSHLKVCFCSRKQEEALAWVLPAFELYVVAAPGAKREAVMKGAQRVVQWVRAEEERLFVIGGATF